MLDLDGQITDILARLEQAYSLTLRDQASAKQLFELLDAHINQVDESWSGSWAGYHANLYYRDFERPGINSRFSIEWGSLHGIPDGWRKRTDAEIASHIQQASGVSISELEELANRAYDRARPLYQDVQAVVTPILEASGNSSKALLDELNKETWGVSQHAYLNQVMPKQLISRDSEAVMQGMKVPPHMAFKARAVSAYTRVTATVAAIERAKLALQQARAALSVTARSRSNDRCFQSSVLVPAGSTQLKWVTVFLSIVLATETFVLARPAVIRWFDTVLTQKFLTTPTRLGFSLSDLIANGVSALIFTPFGWLIRQVLRSLSSDRSMKMPNRRI